MDVSQTVLGSWMGSFCILPCAKPVHMDLKVTCDLVRMRRYGGDRRKLGSTVAFSVHCAVAETLALSGNGSKWRHLGRRSALYNRAPGSHWAATPRDLSGAIHGDPTIWHHQRIHCPTALCSLTATW
jgi:hypothetical protein